MHHPQTEFIINELKSLRMERNLSRSEVAKLMEVSNQAILNWETGVTTPTADNIVRWAAALGYEFDLHPIERKRRHVI